jgi:hypothetical protein
MMTFSPATINAVLKYGGRIAAVWYLTWLGVGIDCRLEGRSSLACWKENPLTIQVTDVGRLVTALGGLGIGGVLGYHTYNPALRDPRRGEPDPNDSTP